MKYFLSIILLLIKINSIEISSEKENLKDSMKTYDKLNYFETIDQDQVFRIYTKVKSIAYFDSFDKNTYTYISKRFVDLVFKKDERINGKFYQIEPNLMYYVRNYLYSSPSVLKKYVYPMNLNESEIVINDDLEEINYLYLQKNKYYTLNFQDNKIKKMIKLSHKTLNSKIAYN